jgi:hypothetical protein
MAGTIGNENHSDWRLGVGRKFGVTADGTVYATAGHFSGEIEASSGKIGGDNGLNIGADGKVFVGEPGKAGSILISATPLAVSAEGKSYSNVMLSVGGKFLVDKDGTIYATGAELSQYTKTEVLEANYSKTTEVESLISASEQGITANYSKAIAEAKQDISTELTTNYSKTTDVKSLIASSEQGITLNYSKAITEAKQDISTELTTKYSTTTEIKSLIASSEQGITASYSKAITDASG